MTLKPKSGVKQIAFNGKLVTSKDPVNISVSDFTKLQNMRYGDDAPHGVGGCTKYNTSALSSAAIRNGIHFRKGNPSESHVIVVTSDGKIWRNGTNIGSQGNFDSAIWSTAGALVPRLTIGPDGTLIACNGTNTLVYGGTESRCARFLDKPSTGEVYDYTEEINNDKDSADQLATIHSGNSPIDENTVLLLHLDNDVTDDSPTTPHTPTNPGSNVTFETTDALGTHRARFNGSNAYITVPYDAGGDFNFSDGDWGMDFQLSHDVGSGIWDLYYNQISGDSTSYISIYTRVGVVSGVYRASFGIDIVSSGVTQVSLETPQAYPVSSRGNRFHVEFDENGDDYYIFVNGNLAAHSNNPSKRPENYTGDVYIGGNGPNSNFDGALDEIRVSNTYRHIASFTPPSAPYGTGYSSISYIGSVFPLSGFKPYIKNVNTVTSTMAVNEWTGGSWDSLSITDNTASGGISLATTEQQVTWSSTADTSKPKIIEDTLLYWYQVIVTADSNFTVDLSRITVLYDIQQLKELWDGEPRSLTSFVGIKSGEYQDFTPNVFEDSIDSNNTYTWAAIGQYTSSDEIIFSSYERLMGVILNLPEGAVNTNNVVISLSIYDGSAWQEVSIDDTTRTGAKSLSKSGIVTWNPPQGNLEHRQSNFPFHVKDEEGVFKPKFGDLPSYYYKIGFSGTLSGSDTDGVKIQYAAGIPAPQTVSGYSFAVEHQNSLWLFDDYTGRRNEFKASAPNTAHVFNGKESFQDVLGTSSDPPLAAASLITKTGIAIADALLIPKANETFIITGTNPEEYVIRKIKENIGIAAPETMVVIPFGDEAIQGVSRNVCMWIATQGAIMCDGYSAVEVSGDISDLFDPQSDTYLGASAIASSTAFYDPVYNAYVWCIGGTTTYRYDLRRKKWYEVPMSSSTRLYGGFSVLDSNGVSHAYGYGNTGYVWYLDNGNDFDGDDIDQLVRIAAVVPERGSVFVETLVNKLALFTQAKSNTSNYITVKWYGDGDTTGTILSAAVSPQRSGKRMAKTNLFQAQSFHISHEYEISLSTNDEPKGLSPLFMVMRYETREDR